MSWYVYLLECRDGSLYTGITNDVEARFAAHCSGKGARYTRAHPPLRVAASIAQPDRSSASRHEAAIKRLRTLGKWELVERHGLQHLDPESTACTDPTTTDVVAGANPPLPKTGRMSPPLQQGHTEHEQESPQ